MDARVERLERLSEKLQAYLARLDTAAGAGWDAADHSWRQCVQAFDAFREAIESMGDIAPEDRHAFESRLREVSRLYATATSVAAREKDDLAVQIGRVGDKKRSLERHRLDARSGTLCDLRG